MLSHNLKISSIQKEKKIGKPSKAKVRFLKSNMLTYTCKRKKQWENLIGVEREKSMPDFCLIFAQLICDGKTEYWEILRLLNIDRDLGLDATSGSFFSSYSIVFSNVWAFTDEEYLIDWMTK